jgi:hypothetical protein
MKPAIIAPVSIHHAFTFVDDGARKDDFIIKYPGTDG